MPPPFPRGLVNVTQIQRPDHQEAFDRGVLRFVDGTLKSDQEVKMYSSRSSDQTKPKYIRGLIFLNRCLSPLHNDQSAKWSRGAQNAYTCPSESSWRYVIFPASAL